MDTLQIYKLLTITHREARLQDIGKFVLTDVEEDAALYAKLEYIKQELDLSELLYLATCNRVLFFFTTERALDINFLQKFYETAFQHLSIEDRQLAQKYSICFDGEHAIKHLFEVASSVNSLVVGEREILRQLRLAFESCSRLEATDHRIRLAMRFAVENAKRVHSETCIGEKQISVVSLAMKKLEDVSIDDSTRFLIVGAGQTNKLVAKFLKKYSKSKFTIFNRTFDNAQQIATFLEGEAHLLSDLSTYTEGFDVLIVCTGATEPVITPVLYPQLLQGDSSIKTIVDLSIPNNVDRRVIEAYPINYIEIENLRTLANQNLEFRLKEVQKAKSLILESFEEFAQEFQSRQITRALGEVPVQIKALKSHAVNNVFKNELDSLDPNSKELVDRILAYMERRCIGIPMKVAKEAFMINEIN